MNGQREISRGLSLTAGYARRWFGNFLVTDDLNHTINDYESFSVSGIPAPPASAGGGALPRKSNTDRFYVLKPTAANASSPYTGTSDRLFPGSHVIDHWNGFDISLNARLGRGAILQGGMGTGRQTYDNCDIADPTKATQWDGHSIVGTM